MAKFDVHHHFYPPIFAEVLERAGGDPSGWTIPSWSIEEDEKMMSEIGVGKSILSVTAPGPCVEKDPKAAARLARQCNEAAAAIRDSRPSSYGFFATLPSLLDTESTLEEIAYALDHLNADDVILYSRYGDDNHYLGHPDFEPIWDELNRRKVVVFIHPTHGIDTRLINPHLPQPMFDYAHETGRTAVDLITSRRVSKVPDCKIILSHAGGTLPYLIYRIAGMLPYTQFSIGLSSQDVTKEAQNFYFDTALSSSEYTLPLLLQFAPPGHILFGTDFPNCPPEAIKNYSKFFDAHKVSKQKRQELDTGAALELFPRFKSE